MVDDLRLALARSGMAVPDADGVDAFDAPGGLIALGEFMSPAIEAVVENHVDRRIPAVIEGDGILPSLFDRPPIRKRATSKGVHAVFLYEPDEDSLIANHHTRGVGVTSRTHARKNHRFGEWLRHEAERRGLPTLPARPWDTLAARMLAAAGLT